MSTEAETTEGRRPYEEPHLRTINLVAEEVMAVGCKLPSAGGQNAGQCFAPTCFTPGS